MNFDTLKKEFPEIEIYQNHPLAPYTTLKIGGPADIFIHTKSTDEFTKVIKYISNAANASLTILGNGSNVLISDSGIRGIVIKNSSNKIEYLSNNLVKVDSGVQLQLLINDTVNHSLSGLEEFAYIPSTIGGAICGNIHGDDKNNFNQLLNSIDIFDLKTQQITTVNPTNLSWDYDYSQFQDHPNWIILSATISLQPGNQHSLKEKFQAIIQKKTLVQSMNSAGSVFKNPKNDFVGRIIDQELNLKGFGIGDAQISEKHANFIINLGHATATDYLAVINKVQIEAKSKLNLILEPEIKFLGDFSK